MEMQKTGPQTYTCGITRFLIWRVHIPVNGNDEKHGMTGQKHRREGLVEARTDNLDKRKRKRGPKKPNM